MTYLLTCISLIFVAIAGVCRAARTVRTDLNQDTPLYDWITTHPPIWGEWYAGGNNARWNPSLPSWPGVFWAGDFWHTFTSLYAWAFCIAAGIASLAGMNLTQAALFTYFCTWIEGATFVVFYHNIWRRNPPETVWQLLSHWNPFINTH